MTYMVVLPGKMTNEYTYKVGLINIPANSLLDISSSSSVLND